MLFVKRVLQPLRVSAILVTEVRDTPVEVGKVYSRTINFHPEYTNIHNNGCVYSFCLRYCLGFVLGSFSFSATDWLNDRGFFKPIDELFNNK